ncbi:MAG: hypothetical protein COA96_12340 [SAR86 cluster bacterium]|uniref:Uncharacterized protein n=1 Tax=SAR86 cluster bacterium TaxID=2030880 RepID=A0A2A5AVC1_9GAMM|nr:MAG: hypothetical protein COA96_12340 [SAR86 cluster bacterium]
MQVLLVFYAQTFHCIFLAELELQNEFCQNTADNIQRPVYTLILLTNCLFIAKKYDKIHNSSEFFRKYFINQQAGVSIELIEQPEFGRIKRIRVAPSRRWL